MTSPTNDLATLTPGLANVYCPLDGVITAGQPTREHLERLAAAGYHTVLDLRAADEPRGLDEVAVSRELGLEYVALPVTGATVGDGDFDRFRTLLGDPARRPILVHCASANRVGALLYPYLVLDEGEEPTRAMEVARAVGLRSPDLAAKAIDYVARHGAD